MLALVDGQPRVLNLRADDAALHRPPRRDRRPAHQVRTAARAATGRTSSKACASRSSSWTRSSRIIRGSANVEEARNEMMKRFGLSQLQAEAILNMQLRQLTALEREKIEDEYKDLLKRIALPRGPALRPAQDPGRHQGRAEVPQGQVRRRAQDPHRPRRGRRDRRRGHDPRRGDDHHHHPRRLHQARADRHLPRAEARRQGHHRRDTKGRGQGRAPVRRDHAPLHPLLHGQRARLPAEGLRDPADHAPGDGHGDHQPDLHRAGRQDHRHRRRPGDGHGRVHGHGHGAGRGQEDRPRRCSTTCAPTACGRSTSKRATRCKWVAISNGSDEVILVTRNGMSIRFHEKDLRSAGRASGGVRGIRLRRATASSE